MHPGELRPADRLHLGRRVQLHRARAQRDHRPVEGDVEVRQPPQVAQHRGLAPVLAEHRVSQVSGGAPQRAWQRAVRLGEFHVRGVCHEAEGGHEGPQLVVGGGLVAADLQGIVRRQVEVVPSDPRAFQGVNRLVASAREDDPDRVEEITQARSVPVAAQRSGQHRGATVHAPCDGRQPVRAVVGGVHGRGHRQQDLRRADVARRLFPADVLLAGLQREPVGGAAVGVHRHPDQPAGQLALQRVADRDVARVRAAEPQRHAEPLGGPHRDVGARLTGRPEQGEREQVGGHRDQRPRCVRRLDQRRGVADDPGGAGELQQHAEQVTALPGDGLWCDRLDHQVDAEWLGPGAEHRQGLRQAVGVREKNVTLAGSPPGQRHGLGGRGRLVEQRRAGPGQPGQVGHHGLEVQQRLQPALGDLRLVRGVRRVPGGVLQHVAADHGRGDRVVVAQADHRGEQLVPPGHPAQLGQRPGFGERIGQLEIGRGRPVRQGGGSELVERGIAQAAEHVQLLSLCRADVADGEICHGASPGRARSLAPRLSRRPNSRQAAPEMPIPAGSCA